MNVRRLCQKGLDDYSTHGASPPLSTSIFKQVALDTTHFYSTSAPPASTTTTFLNPESSDNAYTLGRPHMTSSFHSRSRIPFESTVSIPYNSSPERSPNRKSLDFPNGATRGRPPPTQPVRKLHHLQQQDHHNQKSHTRSQPYRYSDPFTGSFKQLQEHPTNVNESLEKFYGPSNINNLLPPSAPHYHRHNSKYPKSHVQNHFISFIHLHRLSRLSLDYKLWKVFKCPG